jgi:endonuclease YncB( thermonuclease family)
MNYKALLVTLALLAPSLAHAYTPDIALSTMNVDKVYDGDTITIDLPGQHDLFGKEIGVRLKGINAPEMVSACSTPELRAAEKVKAVAAKSLVESMVSAGKRITLSNLERDKYFRILATVQIDGRDVSAALIAQGLADPYNGGSKVSWCGR